MHITFMGRDVFYTYWLSQVRVSSRIKKSLSATRAAGSPILRSRNCGETWGTPQLPTVSPQMFQSGYNQRKVGSLPATIIL